MIITRLVGGLGNQMFQYAAGRRLADRLGAKLKLDLSLLHREGNRQYGLDRFHVRAPVTRYLSLDFYEGRHNAALRPWIIRRYGAIVRSLYVVMKEPVDMSLSNEVLQTRRRHTILSGFWQSEKYFLDDAEAIRQDLTLKAPPIGQNKDLMSVIAQVNAVSLHVRRGDYVHKPQANAFHGLCSLEYYQKAVARIAAQVPAPHFFIFSDDPEWSRLNLRLSHPATFVTHNGADHAFEDLRLMSCCRHHIIANSSFSWWGAWLAAPPGGLVVAPERWYAVSTINTANLLPPAWIRL